MSESGAFLPEQRFGSYVLEREIARGGQGVVFHARHETGRSVALKLLQHCGEADVKRFRQEAAVLQRVAHPNVVRVFESGEFEGTPFMATDFVDGQDLAQMLRGGALPSAEWAAQVLATVAVALHSCHQLGVVHRDIKPANVIVERTTQRPVLIDFGLVRRDPNKLHLSSLDTSGMLSAAGTVTGTPEYMAPEQVNPETFGQVSPRTDVYGLGATLYHLLAGVPPFEGRLAVVVMRMLTRKPPRDPRELNPALSGPLTALCLRCLAKSPADRPASAFEFALALCEVVGLPPPAPPSEPGAALRAASETFAEPSQALSPPTRRFPRPGEVFAGLKIVQELARGGQGAVFVAQSPDGRAFALKILLASQEDEVRWERFQREALVGQELRHPNVVAIEGSGVEQGLGYLLMEYLRDSVPIDVYARNLDLAGRLGLVIQLAVGVDAAHRVGLIHRDLKPDNVLVTPAGQVKVLDFGLARHTDKERLTLSGQSLGTVHYMSPEQIMGESAQADARTDIYALGVMLYELVSGRRPFPGDSSYEIMAGVLADTPADPCLDVSGTPPGLREAILKAMAREPEDRHASAAELGRELSALRAASSEGPPAPRRVRLLVLAALALLGLLGAVGARLLSGDELRVAGSDPPSESVAPTTAGKVSSLDPDPDSDPLAPLRLPEPTQSPLAEPPRPPGSLRSTLSQGGFLAVHRVGPWIVFTGPGESQLLRGGSGDLLPLGVKSSHAPVWDGTRRRLLFSSDKGVVACTPGEGTPRLLFPLAGAAGLTLLGDQLLVGCADGRLRAYELGSSALRWSSKFWGVPESPALPLDLDEDGSAERALACTLGSEVGLLTRDGRLVAGLALPSPALGPPLLVGPDARGGATVLVTCVEGQLRLLRVHANALEVKAELDLLGTLTATPAVLGSEAFLLGASNGYLYCVAADLSKVRWARRAPWGQPLGPIATCDMDQDGRPEILSAWFDTRLQRGQIALHTPQGAAYAPVAVRSKRPFQLSGGDALPLWRTGERPTSYGPWTDLPEPEGAVDLARAEASLVGGAFEACASETEGLAQQEARWLSALAAWWLGSQGPLEESLAGPQRERLRAHFKARSKTWIELAGLGAARRWLRPLGLELSSTLPGLSPFALQTGPPEAGSLSLEFRAQPAVASGDWVVRQARTFQRRDRQVTGVLLQQSGCLEAKFRLRARGTYELALLHWSIPNVQPGYASVEIHLDDVPLGGPRQAPKRPGVTEVLSLDRLEAGEHTLRLQTLPGQRTHYALLRLEVRPSVD